MNFPVLISYSNDGYYDFAKNMLLNLNSKIRFHKVHFFCLDTAIYEKLTALFLPNLDITFELYNATSVSATFESYGTKSYNTITHTKVNILYLSLQRYNFIHFIDCDVVCVNEPTLAHYEKYEKYDIVFQYDCGMYSADKLHSKNIYHIWTCTGNTSLRSSEATYFLLDKISEYQIKHQNLNDQECLEKYFKDEGISDISEYTRVKLNVYDLKHYTNGYWLDNNIGSLEDTYFFHANHVIGKEAKMKLLKKAKLYYL
jgi:hypothetical protein